MSKYGQFTRNFYIYRFFKDFAFIYAVYVILFKLSGLSVLDISLLLALWSGFVVVLEVPTGALSDKWNRKYMLILGMLFKSVGFAVWIFANNFITFALGFLFWGMGSSFSSGTQEALLFDNLKKFKKTDMYEKVTGHAKFYSNIAIGASVFIGGILASYSFDIVLVMSSLFMLVSIIPILSFKEIKSGKTSTKETKYFHLIRGAFKQALKNKTMLRLLLYSVVAFSFIGTLNEYEQLYFNWLSIPLSLFGVIAVLINLVDSIGCRFAYKFKKRFESWNSFYLLLMLSGILLIVSVSYRSVLFLSFFVLLFMFNSIGRVLVESKLQRQIKTEQRATILSINSLLGEASAIFLTAGFGIISQMGDLTWGFVFFGLLVVLFSAASIFTTFSRK